MTYNERIETMQKYISVNGMFELQNQDHSYEPRDSSLNKNSSDWKPYNTTVNKNKYGLQELSIDLSDAVLKGTSSSIEYMDQFNSRF